jgi:hypothetical protein
MYPSSKIFHRSLADAIPRVRQSLGPKKTMLTLSFAAETLIVMDVLPKDMIFNQLYFGHSVFPNLKQANMNLTRQSPRSTFPAHKGNSMCHNGLKVTSKFNKYHLSRMPRLRDSTDISPCDLWLFGLTKGILKDREFNSIDESEEAPAKTETTSLLMTCRASS